MKKKLKTLTLMSLLFCLGVSANSDDTKVIRQDLSSYLSTEISSVDEAVRNELSQVESEQLQRQHSKDESYFLRRFWLRIRPRVGIDIPGLADFEIIPETELLWEKQAPEGWEIYRP